MKHRTFAKCWNCSGHWQWVADLLGRFQERRESIPGGCDANVLFATLLKIDLRNQQPHFSLSTAKKIGVLLTSALLSGQARADLHVLIIEGLGGEAKYTQSFDNEVKAIRAANATLTTPDHIQVLSGDTARLETIRSAFKQLGGALKKDDRFVCYLIGHGSFDGYEYKFNIPGPDLSGADLAKLLDALHTDNQLIVATGSASGALQDVLKKDSRVIVAATRNGNERNATHFGASFAEALSDASADVDKNGRISAQEAFDFTVRKVKDYFEAESRLATEHASLQGAHANAFSVAQLSAASPAVNSTMNPVLAAEREHISSQIEELRLKKQSLGEDEYFRQLEPLMVELAKIDTGAPTSESGKP